MNYRHIYHAGNFADVFKHIVLANLLQSFHQKDKPFCFMDTHAGAGRYDLHAKEAQKTHESAHGIEQLIKIKEIPHAIVQTYLNIVTAINRNESDKKLRYYPGSPYIAHYFLRLQDKMILTELHREDAFLLKQAFNLDKQVAVHQQDGYLALKAFLPPKEKRGLVLIDPPFEQTNELEKIYQGLEIALKRWSNGIYAIWYPIKEKNVMTQLYHHLKKLNQKEILQIELSIYPEDSPISLNGSGMAIINPPWQLKTELEPVLSWLWQVLSPEKLGGYRIKQHLPDR